MKKTIFIRTVLFTILLVLISSAAISASSTKIYSTEKVDHYLKMSLFIEDDYLIYNQNLKPEELNNFQKQINNPKLIKQNISNEIINKLYNKKFSGSEYIVIVKEEKLEWKILGTQLAYHLDSPVYFNYEKKERNKNKKKIILGKKSAGEMTGKNFTEFREAYNYYRKITKESSFQILINADEFGVMGTYFANKKNGFINFDQIEKIKSSMVAWVTNPVLLEEEKIINFQNSMDFDKDGIYDYPLGILTGINPSYLSLLIERNRYFNENIPKKHKLLSLDVDSGREKNNEKSGNYERVDLNGKEATITNLKKELIDTTYFHFVAHGAGTGFALKDGSFNSDNMPEIPLQITIGESCSTGKMPKDPENSIALNFLKKGSVAYLGSFRVGGVGTFGGMGKYFLTTSDLPLGQMVRLQNYGIKKWIDNVSRALLFGDPSLRLFNKEFYNLSADNKINFNIPEEIATSLNSFHTLGVALPVEEKFKSLEINNGNKEVLSQYFMDRFISLPFADSQVIIFATDKNKGEVTFKKNISIFKKLQIAKQVVETGLFVLFDNVFLNSVWWAGFVVTIIIMISFLKRDIISFKTAYLFIPFILMYLILIDYLEIRFQFIVCVIYYLLVILPLLFRVNIIKKIVIYFAALFIPLIPVFIIAKNNYRTIGLLLIGIFVSGIIPLILEIIDYGIKKL